MKTLVVLSIILIYIIFKWSWKYFESHSHTESELSDDEWIERFNQERINRHKERTGGGDTN